MARASYSLLNGEPKGGFVAKLSGLVNRGFVSPGEKVTLEAVADAGNASAHWAIRLIPSVSGRSSTSCKNSLQRAFVLLCAADEVRSSTPRRPKENSRGVIRDQAPRRVEIVPRVSIWGTTLGVAGRCDCTDKQTHIADTTRRRRERREPCDRRKPR